MRFFLTAMIWLLMVGGLGLYIKERDRRLPRGVTAPVTETVPADDYALEITPTFTPVADPFALQSDPAAAATLVVRLGGRELFRGERELPAGRAVTIKPLSGVVVGQNELYLKASPPLNEAVQDHAVRVRLLRGGQELLDQTLWGRSGATVAGTIPFVIARGAEDSHGH